MYLRSFVLALSVFFVGAALAETTDVTVQMSGEFKRCKKSSGQKKECKDHRVSVFVYFDKDGNRYVFADAKSGVILKKGKSTGTFFNKQYQTLQTARFSSKKNCHRVAYNIAQKNKKRPDIYNKYFEYHWHFCVSDSVCNRTKFRISDSYENISHSRFRVIGCKRFSGRKAAQFTSSN